MSSKDDNQMANSRHADQTAKGNKNCYFILVMITADISFCCIKTGHHNNV